jgi:hypothetical protein
MSHAPRRRHLLTAGNTHLGAALFSFSIPAAATCPGATDACLAHCYALKFRFRHYPDVVARHHANWNRTLDPERFAADMGREIRQRSAGIVRIHVSGDFYNAAYTRAWLKVVRSCPRTTFLFYTRSWRVPEIAPLLVELASRPTVFAWWSEDRDSGPCRLPGGRRCYLAVDAADEAAVPQDVDLVFRARHRAPRKWCGSVWTCAKEQGVPHGLTCSSCRRCFVPGPMPRRPEGRAVPGADLISSTHPYTSTPAEAIP